MNKKPTPRTNVKIGVVTSDKMDKTRVVSLDRYIKHPKYHKRYLVSKKFKAHDPENKFKLGDKVEIRETKPISKDKRWLIIAKV